MQQEQVILVNEQDEPRGTMAKLEAHRRGLLHRAFSVLVFNERNELLLQQRALGKYHSAGLWTNTCCSHPQPGEATEAAAHRRLMQEMGFDCELQFQFSFIYKVQFADGTFEHELDHVFTGSYNGTPAVNAEEVAGFTWVSIPELKKNMEEQPEQYTYWLKQILERL